LTASPCATSAPARSRPIWPTAPRPILTRFPVPQLTCAIQRRSTTSCHTCRFRHVGTRLSPQLHHLEGTTNSGPSPGPVPFRFGPALGELSDPQRHLTPGHGSGGRLRLFRAASHPGPFHHREHAASTIRTPPPIPPRSPRYLRTPPASSGPGAGRICPVVAPFLTSPHSHGAYESTPPPQRTHRHPTPAL